MKKNKLICPLVTISAIAGMMPMALTMTSCGNYQNKYSQIVQNIVLMLKEMNKNPRCTSSQGGHTYLDAVRNFIEVEAIKAGVDDKDICKDEYGNLWFDVKASEGCESYEPLIIQGHMDMVVAGLSEEEKPITPIDTEIDWKNGIVHSKNYKTSLGADDGFGICAALAVIQDKTIKHGPLRIFCSADEDSGMIGAAAHFEQYGATKNAFTNMGKNLDGKEIKYLLNIDAEEMGEIYRSCAGSITYNFQNTYDATAETILNKTYSINISGFKGGHSGGDLVKNRANADKCAFEILNKIKQSKSIQLVEHAHPKLVDGEIKDIAFQRNQIVSHSQITFNVSAELKTITDAVETCKQEWKNTYTGEDWTKVNIEVKEISARPAKYLAASNSSNIIDIIGTNNSYGSSTKSLWYGYTPDGSGGYTKSANVGPVALKLENNKLEFKAVSQTRCIGTKNYDDMKKYYDDLEIDDVVPTLTSVYKPWEKNDTNKMIDVVSNAYTKVGVTPKLVDCTGGVEPTWWMQCNSKLNCACIGATITNAHDTKETLYINTIQPVVDAIKEILLAMESA